MIKLKLKTGDKVRVISGSYKGKEGNIKKVIPSMNKAIVEGIFMATKRHKPNASNPQGAISRIEKPIDISNLMLVMKDGSFTRVGFKKEGEKTVRYSKKTGEII